jgi:hypothetical protein
VGKKASVTMVKRKASKPDARRPWRRVHACWKGYAPLNFVDFVAERQRVHERRQKGLSQAEWTDDPVLRRGRFCNIDRRCDAVTRELLAEWERRRHLNLLQQSLIAAALRFTSSRRGAAQQIASIVDCAADSVGSIHSRSQGSTCSSSKAVISLSAERLGTALTDGTVGCGTGTYQMTLSRAQVAHRLERCAYSVVQRIESHGAFKDVASAGAFVADHMALRRSDSDRPGRDMRPSFASAETAKDFAYLPCVLAEDAAARCSLGPGARKGLAMVRQGECGIVAVAGDDEAAVHALLGELRAVGCLEWMRAIDVEQALCEYSKYVRWVEEGVEASRAFVPCREARAGVEGDSSGPSDPAD